LRVFAGRLGFDEFGGSIHLNFNDVGANVALHAAEVLPDGKRSNGSEQDCNDENNGPTSHFS
jgi:hypothetical protein